ncbi:hypothetical protein, partial [Cryobacterium sp. M96]|uniref:hypothetical protein n=1 Tax=Cryobacterium sp. M96 TaxID=2048295 RepID=UPI001E563F2D
DYGTLEPHESGPVFSWQKWPCFQSALTNLASFHRARVWVMSYVFVGKQCRSEHRCLLKCEDDLIDLLAITDEP